MVGSASGQKQSVKFLQNMVYTAQFTPPSPPQTRIVCINCTFSLGKGGGGEEVREKIEGQQYTRIVPSSIGATVYKWVENTNQRVNVSPVYKIC